MPHILIVEKLKKEPVKKTISIFTIGVLLLNIIFYNGLFFGFSPKAQAATVPIGVIIAWPGTEVSIPEGWDRVATLDTYYVEGSTSTPSVIAQGTSTHTHTSPPHSHDISHTHTGTTGGSAGSLITGLGAGAVANLHIHTITTDANIGTNVATSSNFDTRSNDPPYTEVIWIESDGTAGIPNGAWAFYNSDSFPTNWTRQNGNRFLKGAAAGNGGGAQGGSSDSHTHTDLGHTHMENPHTHTGTTDVSSGSSVRSKAGTGLSVGTHTHTISAGTTTATEQSGTGVIQNSDGQPPFYKLNIIQNGTGGEQTPNNIIAMWDGNIGSVPSGWVVCDGTNGTPNLNDKFIKGANANLEIGTEGGALTHTHDAGAAHSHTINAHTHNFTVDPDTGGQVGPLQTGLNGAAYTHTHTLSVNDGTKTTGTATVTADANVENRPPFKEVVYIQYRSSNLTQSDFRIYENIDAVQPTTALALQNASTTDIAQDQVIRLRMNVLVASSTLATSSQAFKLQYADKGVSTDCTDVAGGNFADIGQIASSTIWRGYNNASVADGATTTTPLLSNSDKNETYEESNPSKINTYAVAIGERGEWDWVVQNNGATTSATYCFRMVMDDGTELNTYVRMPEVTTIRGLVQLRYRWRNDDGGE